MRNVAKKIVTNTINNWDPEGLLEIGAPDDEYESEIEYIVECVLDCKNEIELAEEMQYKFTRMLGRHFDFDICLAKAKKIWRDLYG